MTVCYHLKVPRLLYMYIEKLSIDIIDLSQLQERNVACQLSDLCS